MKGRKRQIAVDSLRMLLGVRVHAANGANSRESLPRIKESQMTNQSGGQRLKFACTHSLKNIIFFATANSNQGLRGAN